MSSNPYEKERTALIQELELLKHKYLEEAKPIHERLMAIAAHDRPQPIIVTREEAKLMGFKIDG